MRETRAITKHDMQKRARNSRPLWVVALVIAISAAATPVSATAVGAGPVGTSLDAQVGAQGEGGGVGYATCDLLGTACAVAAADTGSGCATASATLTIFPGSATIQACTGWGLACGGGLGLRLVDAVVAGDAEVDSTSKGPGSSCHWWNPFSWTKCGKPTDVKHEDPQTCSETDQ